jgi:hypothetical protein
MTTLTSLKLRRIDWGDGGQPREDYEVVDARGETPKPSAAAMPGTGRSTAAVTNHPPAG